MATTENFYTGNGSTTSFGYSFPILQNSDLIVEVNGVEKTENTSGTNNDYSISGTNVVFNTAPNGASGGNPADDIHIFRRTNVDSAKAVFAAGSSIRAGDLNNNIDQSLYANQEQQQKIKTSDIRDIAVTTAKIKDLNVTTAKIAADAIDGTKIADNAINSEHYTDGSIDRVHLSADIIDGTKLANDSINSEHYVDGSIDTAHIGDAQIITAKIGANAVTTAKIAADAVTNAKIADDSIDSEHYVDGSIDTAHIADSQINTAKLATDAVSSAKIQASAVTDGKIAAGAVSANKIATDAVTSVKIQAGAVTDGKIAASAVTANKIATDAVTSAKIQANAVTDGKIAASAVTENKIANSAVTANKIASNAVTTDKIADGELTTLAGMQSTTASTLASGTALTASTAELNQLDGITLETTLTSSDTRIPTSKAVNDQILAVTNALGGFVAIADETSFPTSNPDPSDGAGTVVSISQVSSGSAVTINNSGVATISNGAGTGNTVTITGFPSTLRNTSLAASSGLQVQTTTTSGNGSANPPREYTFHKQLASAADIAAISATVNSFSNRYRVSSSAPTSSLDGGDLWYDTTNSKLMVYSSQNSAWEESSAIGNFFISTLSSSSNTGGGSATANGTAYRFTISDAPVSAQQLIVSVDGVIQKPNSGTSQPSEGFALSGNDIIFGSAPANGASIFVTVIGSTVGIGTPSNNTVTTAILQNGSVTTAKIVDANVTTAKITDANVTTAKIANDAITNAKIADGAVDSEHLATGILNNSNLFSGAIVNTAQIVNNAVTTNEIADNAVTSAKISAGAVHTADISDSQITTAKIADSAITSAKISNGAVHTADISDSQITTAKIADDAVTAAKLANTSVSAGSYGSSTSIPSITVDAQGRITAASGNTVNTDLVGDTSPQLGGSLDVNGNNISFVDSTGTNNNRATFGASNDMAIYHDGSNSRIKETGTGHLILSSDGNGVLVQSDNGQNLAKFLTGGAAELYHNYNKKLETTSTGVTITGGLATSTQAASYFYGTVHCNADDDTRLRLNVPSNNSDDWNYIAYYGRDGNRDGFIGSWSDGTMTVYSDASGGHFIKFHSGDIEFNNHLKPNANNALDLGTSSYRWRNIYTNDLNLSNEGSSNDVDGTWGDWTIQEGESDLFLKNNRSGKKYKFNLTEVS